MQQHSAPGGKEEGVESIGEMQLAFLSAMCLFLSAVEYAVPKPLPFMRLGLANLPVIIAVKKWRFKSVVLLIALKVAGQALLSGTLFSYIFIFSVSGSFASGIVMLVFHRIFYRRKIISSIALSLSGAMANCAVQIILSSFFFFGKSTRFIAPLLCASSSVTGFLMGLFCNAFEETSEWMKAFFSSSAVCLNPDKPEKKKISKYSILKTAFLAASMIFIITVKDVYAVWAMVLVFLALNLVKKHGNMNLLPSVVVVVSVTVFSLLTPYGKVLFELWGWKITGGALEAGLQKSGTLVGMVLVSKYFMDADIRIPGKIGDMVSSVMEIFRGMSFTRKEIKDSGIMGAVDGKLLSIWKEISGANNESLSRRN